jgi:hypothetical protein
MIAMTSSITQRGVITIFISMVMLTLITVMVITAYSLSTTNLRAVGNDPNEAGLIDFPVRVNNDNISPEYEYLVDVAVPRCVRAYRANSLTVSSVTKPGMSASGAFNTIWELDAIATEAASGANVRVIHGVRILMDEVRKNQLCP